MVSKSIERTVSAVHARRSIEPDPDYIRAMACDLRRQYGGDGLQELYERFARGVGTLDTIMRRILWQALAKSCGDGLQVDSGVGFRHPETFDIGKGVFIGSQTCIQGRFDGSCRIGDHVWIGPQSYLDARDLVLEEYVGWGPGARVLGSSHTGLPVDAPIIETDLVIKPVRVGKWSDIGTAATLLPGVTIGEGAIVGAGSVVTHDIPAYAKAAGVPARVIGWTRKVS